MIEEIFSILVDIGFVREDYKHHKKITAKEKKDGVKRPFQRFFLQPSFLIIIMVLIIVTLSASLLLSYRRKFVYQKQTKKEIIRIADKIQKWNENLGRYPMGLNELIGNNPLRQDWKKDAWNRDYVYTITKDGKQFLLVSAGFDGQFGTADDIKIE